MKFLQPISIAFVAILTVKVSSKPTSSETVQNDYEDYAGSSFEVMSFDDKPTGAEESTFDNSFDYLDFPTVPTLPPLRHQMTHSDPNISNTSQTVSTLESNSTTPSAVLAAPQEEELVEIDPQFLEDDQQTISTLMPPTGDSNVEQEDEQIAFQRGGFVSLYSTQSPPTEHTSTRKPRRRLPKTNYKSNGSDSLTHTHPNISSSSSDDHDTEEPRFPSHQDTNALSSSSSSFVTPPPLLEPLNFNLNSAALPSHHAGTPHRLVVELSAMEQRIKRRFKDLQDKTEQINKRVTEVNAWMHNLDREYLAKKEHEDAGQEQRSSRVRELFKKTSQSFESARRERTTLYRNSESLRRMINSHKAHHEEELRRFAIGAGQNFGIVQEEVTRLFNMINKLSQIQNFNGEYSTSFLST